MHVTFPADVARARERLRGGGGGGGGGGVLIATGEGEARDYWYDGMETDDARVGG